ncbi:MAG TPA: hypothetical protein VIK28_03685, partial [Sedimentisphaerales bacterium]
LVTGYGAHTAYSTGRALRGVDSGPEARLGRRNRSEKSRRPAADHDDFHNSKAALPSGMA